MRLLVEGRGQDEVAEGRGQDGEVDASDHSSAACVIFWSACGWSPAGCSEIWSEAGRFCSSVKSWDMSQESLRAVASLSPVCKSTRSWDVGAKLENSLARSNRSRFG